MKCQKLQIQNHWHKYGWRSVFILKDRYREVMTGAITLYNKEGDRMLSLYYAVEPEHGKKRFFDKMESQL